MMDDSKDSELGVFGNVGDSALANYQFNFTQTLTSNERVCQLLAALMPARFY